MMRVGPRSVEVWGERSKEITSEEVRYGRILCTDRQTEPKQRE